MRLALVATVIALASAGCLEPDVTVETTEPPAQSLGDRMERRTVDLGGMGFLLGVVPGASIHLGIDVPANATRILILVELQRGASNDLAADGPGDCSDPPMTGVGGTLPTRMTYECDAPPAGPSEVVLTHRAGWVEGQLNVTAEVVVPTL